MDNLIIDNTKTIQDVINQEDRNILILFTSISDEVLNKNIINNVFEIKDIYETLIYNFQKDLEFKHYYLYNNDNTYIYLFKITEKYNYKFINDQLYNLYFDICKNLKLHNLNNLYTYLEFKDNNIIDCLDEILKLLSNKINVFLLKNENN